MAASIQPTVVNASLATIMSHSIFKMNPTHGHLPMVTGMPFSPTLPITFLLCSMAAVAMTSTRDLLTTSAQFGSHHRWTSRLQKPTERLSMAHKPDMAVAAESIIKGIA